MAATAKAPDLSALATQVGTLTKNFDTVMEKLSKTAALNQPTPGAVFGAPNVRTGENPMGSRGFSFMKMIGLITGAVDPKDATVEVDIHNRMHKAFVGDLSNGAQFKYAGARPGSASYLAPLSTAFMGTDYVDANFRKEVKSLVNAGVDGYDPDEGAWIRRQQFKNKGYNAKALSWLQEVSGGALVPPPEQGELIELLRNKEALVNAGARVVPLPPQGRIVYPRQTGASTTYWVGENSPIPESEIRVGEIALQAKKLAVLIKMPNELIKFANPAAEALVRDDMTKSLALALDLAGLEAAGTDNRPRGIIRTPGINTVTSSKTGVDGDAIVGEDIYRMIAVVEEANSEFGSFIMRPKTLYKYYQLRADAVAQGDKQGMFLFNLIREASGDTPATLAGYPVVKSTQVSQVRSKGAATNLSYIIGGKWDEMLMGMFGAIEFAQTNTGDTAFVNDQTWVRGILSCDVNVRHPAAFAFMDNLITNA